MEDGRKGTGVQGDLYSRLDRKELVVKTSVKHTSGNEAIFHQR